MGVCGFPPIFNHQITKNRATTYIISMNQVVVFLVFIIYLQSQHPMLDDNNENIFVLGACCTTGRLIMNFH